MSSCWRISADEDDRLQGLTADAQVIYMRLLRRYMNFDTCIAQVSLSQMRRVLEHIPDPGSSTSPRRVADVSNHYVRARIAEIERAGLISPLDKKNKFDTPRFLCACASAGELRPNEEPQRNRKDGTAKGADKGGTRENLTVAPHAEDAAEVAGAAGAAKEPQGRNRNTSGVPGKDSPPYGGSSEGGDAHVISLPLADGSEAPVTEAKRDEWQELFPGVDVDQALRAMRAWLTENSSRRKTRRGVGRFVVNWLERDQNRGNNRRDDGAKVMPHPRARTRQEAQEQRNRQVAENWVPPEMRRQEG